MGNDIIIAQQSNHTVPAGKSSPSFPLPSKPVAPISTQTCVAGVNIANIVNADRVLLSITSAVLGALFRKRLELYSKKILLKAAERFPRLKRLSYMETIRTELLLHANEIEKKYQSILNKLTHPITGHSPALFSTQELTQLGKPNALDKTRIMIIHDAAASIEPITQKLNDLNYPFTIFSSIKAGKQALLSTDKSFSHIFCMQKDTTARGVDFFRALPGDWRQRYFVLASGDREYFGMYPEEITRLVTSRLDPYEITFLKARPGLYERMVQNLSDSFGAYRVSVDNLIEKIYS